MRKRSGERDLLADPPVYDTRRPMEGRSFRSIKSAQRAMALFELFSRSQRAMTVSEIARALKIPQPSASMLLRNFLSMGYLQYDPARRTYIPNIRISLLGTWVQRRLGQSQRLEDRLDELCRAVNENVFIGIQNGPFAQYVLVQHPGRPEYLEVQSGLLQLMTCTSLGCSLLSQMPDAEIVSWVRRCNAEADSDAYRVNVSDFCAEIENIRRQGYAETMVEMSQGYHGIAVLVPDLPDAPPMAVGVGGPRARILDKKALLIEELQRFSRETRSGA